MSDRTTKVTLTAQVSGYIAGMEKAAKATRDTGSAASKLGQQKDGFTQVGRSLLAIGAVAAVGVGLAIKSFADFDAKMSQVKTLSHATAGEMQQLSNAALTMGQAIGFSATQVADAEIELVKAGISVKDIMGGALKGALQLAAAGQIDVAKATEIATIAMTQFGLKGSQIPHVADLLSAGADKALGGVADLGEALKSGGLVAAQFGVSLDETVGTLSAFANAGLIGEVAGTDLRQMLLKLADPSAQAGDLMKQLGISIYDASGQFVGITNLSGQLQTKLGALAPAQRNAALSTIFGARAIAGANVLYKEGAKGIAKWTAEVNDTGFAAQQARGKMDNLQGDLKKLGAAFESALIKSGSTANGALRGITKTITGLVAAFGQLPGPAQGAVLGFTALVAGLGLLGGGFLTIVPKVAAFKDAIGTLNTSLRSISIAGGVVAIAITALVSILAAVGQAQADAAQNVDDFSASLDQNTAAITKNTRQVALKQLTDNGAIKIAKQLGLSLKSVTDASLGNKDAVAALIRAEAEWQSSGKHTQAEITQHGILWQQLQAKVGITSGALSDAQQVTKDTAKVMADGSTETNNAAQAYQDASSKVQDLNGQLAGLIDTINKANGVGQDAVSKNAAYQDSLAKVQDTIAKAKAGTEGYSTSLDENTAVGADNAAMFADMAGKSQDAAKAQFDVDNNSTTYIAHLKSGKQALIDQITALTGNSAAAQKLADKIYQIPTEHETKILADTAKAKSDIGLFQQAVNRITGKTITIYAQANIDDAMAKLDRLRANSMITANQFALGNVYTTVGKADGGAIAGAGGPRDDRAGLYALSDGEHVLTAADVKAMGGQSGVYRFRAALGKRGYADGGAVYAPSSYMPAPSAAAWSGGSGPTNVSLAGATISASIDGRPFTMIIHEQIAAVDASKARKFKQG